MSGCTYIVIEHSAVTLSSANAPCRVAGKVVTEDEQISDALMIPLALVMRYEIPNCLFETGLSELDHPFETRLFDCADKALGTAVQVWRPRRQFHRLDAPPQRKRQKLRREEWVESWIRQVDIRM
jgi:hypothetical protein